MVQRVKAKIPGDFLRKCPRPGRLRSANKRPQKVMVLSVIGSDGQKCPIIFFDADENIYRPVYEGLLDRPIVPWVNSTSRRATSHSNWTVRPTITSPSTAPG